VPQAAELLQRMTAHKTLGHAPGEELEWLAAHGELRRYTVGETIAVRTQLVLEMVILLVGHLAHYVERGTGRRKSIEWRGGDVTGLLPYSRLTYPPGDTVVEEPSEALVIHRDLFTEMINRCPTVTATLVHAMLDRARQFTSTDLQDEKMISLGRLAAGLAHELNNPASAGARSAKLLNAALMEADEASNALAAAQLSEEERAKVAALRSRSLVPPSTGVFSVIERSDREEEIADWLEAQGADMASSQALAETGVTLDMLDELADTVPAGALDAALRWIAAGYTARSLATDVERATTRIYDLVSAVKRFTYMDRATVPEPASIAQGLMDTVTVLAAKARAKSASVKLDVPADLPMVRAYGGELNQVWSNLLENALDAVGDGGEVIIRAAHERGDRVVVRVIDDGAGIPPDVKGRIFDHFFTTKPMAKATGLGLDLTRRIVHRHDGQIEVDSEPGHTEFRVILPLAKSGRA